MKTSSSEINIQTGSYNFGSRPRDCKCQ